VRTPQRRLYERRITVYCQKCKAPKDEGSRCESCGFPDISIRPTADGRFLVFLPLCPSTNARMIPVRRGHYVCDALSPDARDYIASVSAELAPMLLELSIPPIKTWTSLPLWLILPRTSSDCHNFGKLLFDTLERAGAVENDRYLLPHFRGIWHDRDSAAIVKL